MNYISHSVHCSKLADYVVKQSRRWHFIENLSKEFAMTEFPIDESEGQVSCVQWLIFKCSIPLHGSLLIIDSTFLDPKLRQKKRWKIINLFKALKLLDMHINLLSQLEWPSLGQMSMCAMIVARRYRKRQQMEDEEKILNCKIMCYE